ncbi:RNA 2',3'-cyclic phosphodiesterase [Solimicrobium silvestre]|nr:RNA 2',3'-cyclic phosphodiesterase [Solimicrobium silvestre]
MEKSPRNIDSTSRLFLALWPETTIQNKLKCWSDDCSWPSSASLMRPESLHLTLHFIGNVPNSRLPELVQGLKVSFHPFDLSFGRPEMWAHGVAVLKPDSVPDNLLELHASLEPVLRRLTLPIETRPFLPHITFARHAADALLPALEQEQRIHWHVDGYALIKSQQIPEGRYTLVQRYAHKM